MEKFVKIGIANVKHSFWPFILVSTIMVLIAPAFMGTENLDAYQTAKIIEMYLSLLGILLVIPVFIADMNYSIRDLVRSKSVSMAVHFIVRLFEAIVVLSVLGIGFILFLRESNCSFEIGKIIASFYANSLFLGGLGLLLFAVFDQLAFAYMVPIALYFVNYGADRKSLGVFCLFYMQRGEFEGKIPLLLMGTAFMILAVTIRSLRKK